MAAVRRVEKRNQLKFAHADSVRTAYLFIAYFRARFVLFGELMLQRFICPFGFGVEPLLLNPSLVANPFVSARITSIHWRAVFCVGVPRIEMPPA